MSKVKEYLQNIYLGEGWWNLERFWGKLEKLAQQRDKQKSRYHSTKNWSKHSTHFLGMIAEMTFSLETGVMLDKMLRAEGDSGFDFIHDDKEYDIKGTQYWEAPHLKQYPNPKKWCDYYLLAGIKVGEKQAKIFGYASKEKLQTAQLIDYGYGNQRSLKSHELDKGLPPWLPSLRRKVLEEPISFKETIQTSNESSIS